MIVSNKYTKIERNGMYYICELCKKVTLNTIMGSKTS